MRAPDVVVPVRVLKPEEWRKAQDLTYAQLADLVGGISGDSARRHCLGLQLPDRPTQIRYLRQSRGEVQPNHFLGLPGVHPAEALRAIERTERAEAAA